MKIDEVIFLPETHEYYFRGQRLSGVTSLISPHRRNGSSVVPPQLQKAAERGSAIHKEVERALKTRVLPKGKEALFCVSTLLKKYGKETFFASELLVSDFENIASSVDIVAYKSPSVVDIFDIKTGKVDTDYCAAQLGFYVYLLNLSRSLEVDRCFVLSTAHSLLLPIQPISEKEVKEIIRLNFNNK